MTRRLDLGGKADVPGCHPGFNALLRDLRRALKQPIPSPINNTVSIVPINST